MNNTVEQKPKEMDTQAVLPQQGKKYPIICKFWMMGNCNKDDKCDYLHTEREKIGYQNFPLGLNRTFAATECSMYKLGLCKNGPLCNFRHVKESKSEEELEAMPELPIWYLECILEKPINLIYEDFEEQNKEEVRLLKQKYFLTKPKYNKALQSRQYHTNPMYKYDIYAEKKDSILDALSQKVRYFFIRNKNMDFVQFTMENNIILNTKQNSIKFREAQKSCDEVVFIIFDEENNNFNGFCKFKKELEENEVQVISEHYFNSYSKNLYNKFRSNFPQSSFVKVEWYWKTKLSANKVELIKNPLNDNEVFINSRDGQEVSVDLGNYICRMMIKRLSKEEVKHYMNYKKTYEENDGRIDNFNLKENGLGLGLKTCQFEDKDSLSGKENEKLYPNQNQNQIQIQMQSNSGNSVTNTSTASGKSLNNLNLNSLIYEEINKNTKNATTPNNSIIVTNISNLQVNISQNSFAYEKNKETNKNYADAKFNTRRRSRSRSEDSRKKKKKSKRRSRSKSRSRRRRSSSPRYRSYRKKPVEVIDMYSSPNSKEVNGVNKEEDNYDSDRTVVLKEDNVSVEKNKHKHLQSAITPVVKESAQVNKPESFLNRKLKSEEELSLKDGIITNTQADMKTARKIPQSFSETKFGENKIMKNKLFSNAMDKLALNSSKKDKLK